MVIPIEPQIDKYPSWDIYLSDNSNVKKNRAIDFKSLDLNDMNKVDVENSEKYPKMKFKSVSIDSQLFIDISEKCYNSNYIGVMVHMIRLENGWSQIFWSESNSFSEEKSLRRYYPEGGQVMQFAFPAKNVRYLRFDPLEKPGYFSVSSVDLYCLGE